MKDKCCGNCTYFKYEDVEGRGFCQKFCSIQCSNHICNRWRKEQIKANNGWTEITPDNMDEIDCIPKDKVVIAWIRNNEFRSCSLSCFWFTLKAIAMQGGFYYYVLPELKIE